MNDLEQLSNSELLENYSKILALLKNRGVIRTKNLIGDLGEYYAVEHYNNTPGIPKLQAAPAGTQNIDAISTKGERYSIKSKTGKLTGVFYGINPPNSNGSEEKIFEYVIIVLLDDNFGLNRIVELTWEKFSNTKGGIKRCRLGICQLLKNC